MGGYSASARSSCRGLGVRKAAAHHPVYDIREEEESGDF
jgi:hypothetical protein